jgi:acetyl/propionyl-CoA carboxylase alpha subunit
MGISTVAVYSDADARAPHVRFADEAVHIGPSPSKDSYLNVDKIIEAATQTGAEAIHPGYGFLSENAGFAEACEAAGITFIGPSSDSIRKMGSKTAARQIMASAGVSIVPGYDGEEQSIEVLRKHAIAIGLPVLIKASAGGGGKGMRVVRDASELEAAIEAARRESEKAFGDGSLLLEKYIEYARHVEVQIFGDNYGNLVHLFERECSIQRRHQKVVEESPSPALNAELREKICRAAISAGRAIGYSNAGTVEFILAPSGEFFFIEVNTRLQVEHPLTEMVTGLDLVRLQIEIAEGRPLSPAQADIGQTGHAIEARLYAEDPANSFLPATGNILAWEDPVPIDDLRIDAGVERGSEVGIHYDPLLAKIIAHGPDRETALRKLTYSLKNLAVQGIQTNREFLIRMLEHPDFQNGQYHTGFVDEHLNELIDGDSGEDMLFAGVVAIYADKLQQAQAVILPHIPSNYRNNPFRDPSIRLEIRGRTLAVDWRPAGNDTFEVASADWQACVELVSFERGSLRVSIHGIQRLFRVAEAGDRFFVQSSAASRVVTLLPRYPRAEAVSEHESAFAPMPGVVLKILVKAGQPVSAGDPLLILEAMKMEQTLRSSTDGIVEAILVKQGGVVAPGDTLVEIKPEMRAVKSDA